LETQTNIWVVQAQLAQQRQLVLMSTRQVESLHLLFLARRMP